MDILKSLFGLAFDLSETDTTIYSPDPSPKDIWAFTDPDARNWFANQGLLAELEHDIRNEVMRGEDWLPEELEYKRALRRLLRQRKITDKGSYWYTSPFPTVYRALQNGSLTIKGITYRFQAEDDIVFQCRMTRDKNLHLTGPLFIGRLNPTETHLLCGQMGGAMRGMGS